MSAPDWLARSIRSAFTCRGGESLRKLERVADRIDERTETMKAAIEAVSGKIHA